MELALGARIAIVDLLLNFQRQKNHLNHTYVAQDIGKILSKDQFGQDLDRFALQSCNMIFTKNLWELEFIVNSKVGDLLLRFLENLESSRSDLLERDTDFSLSTLSWNNSDLVEDPPTNYHKFLLYYNWVKSSIKPTKSVNNHEINIKSKNSM